jgi:hypothetical protein
VTDAQKVRWFIKARTELHLHTEAHYRATGPQKEKAAAEAESAHVDFTRASVAVRDVLSRRGGPIYHRPTDALLLLRAASGVRYELMVYFGLTDSTGRKLK